MKQIITLSFLIFIFSISSFAKDNTVVTIDGKNISQKEFEAVYKKNNSNLNDDNEAKTPEEYMEMFIDFKLKVTEAEHRGLDTAKAFVEELKGYRDELAKTYLTDITCNDSLIRDTYFRKVNYIKASHILFKLSKDALPEDTLKAYQKAMDVRSKYLNKEKTFEELAKEYSDDESAETNGGDLGYFSAFRMITPFENAAYNTKVGEISMPVRTSIGYHLIKAIDLKKSEGEVKVAHIMLKFSNNTEVSPEEDAKVKYRIDSLYNLLQNGANFEELAKQYSEDKISGKNGGVMRFISFEFDVEEFRDAAFSLQKDGDYSKPVRTIYGWHIVRRIEKKPVPSFEEIKGEITEKIKKDPQRSRYSKVAFIKNMKNEYGFKPYPENQKKFYELVDKLENDTVTGDFPKEIGKISLFNFAGRDYYGEEFYKFLLNKSTNDDKTLKFHLKDKLWDFEETSITNYEDSRLETKYPEFKSLIQEYHDGILLFSIMEKEVWNKASEDSIGLVNYYNQNKDKYLFGEHFEGLFIQCKTEEAKDTINNLLEQGITDPAILQEKVTTDGKANATVTKGRWEKGANRHIDHLIWKTEKPKDFKENLYFVKGEVKQGGTKTLDEARGLYISDYQSVIDKEWVKDLRAKYKVSVNKKALNKIKNVDKK
jgi:peptidyl-prolyl cis-trans isomerase SurA